MSWLRRPRFWVAMMLGLAAALFVWMLPPRPIGTASLPRQLGPNGGVLPISLVAISTDARFLVTSYVQRLGSDRVHVWDRQGGMQEPAIEVPDPTRDFQILFSPDDLQLAIVMEPADSERDIFLFELSTGQKLKGWHIQADHVLFSDGRLLHVKRNVLYDLATGKELRRLEGLMDEEPYQRSLSPFHDSCQHSFGPYAIYRKNRDVRIYSWLTGELLSEFEGPYDYFQIDDLSRDGRACLLHERYPFGGLGGIQALLDTSNGSKSLRDDRDRMITALSPDGRCIARYGTRDRSTWLEKLLLGKQRHTFVVENWITGEQLARFEGAEHVCFSPQGDYFAVQREDNVIDIYDLRFPTPWGQIAGAAALAGGLTWTIGWLWSRWRSRKQAPAISPAPDTRPH